MKPPCYLTRRERYKPPCMTSPTPELWWAPEPDELDGDPRRISSVYEDRANRARIICCTECPLQQQQTCAKHALDDNASSGVWAAVKLPGTQWRHRGEVQECHQKLRLISVGIVAAHELPENIELLEQAEDFRWCKRCEESKPVFEFYTDCRTGKPAPQRGCKECLRACTRSYANQSDLAG